MPEQQHKFMLVVAPNGTDEGFTDRLTRYMGGLHGTSLTHVAVGGQPDPPSVDPPAPVIVEWFASVPPEQEAWAKAPCAAFTDRWRPADGTLSAVSQAFSPRPMMFARRRRQSSCRRDATRPRRIQVEEDHEQGSGRYHHFGRRLHRWSR
jgi:hypothetical protein